MADDGWHILETSREPKELVSAALTLARSAESADHERLLRPLRSADFLGRLDSENEYAAETRLRIWRVIEALSQNPSPGARGVLVALTQSETFAAEPARVERLIQACAVIRPAPPEVIRFWDEHCQPDDGFTPLTVNAIVENGTEPALRLLEKKMADPHHAEEDKLTWMRIDILIHRDDLPLLQSCERMLAGGLPGDLRPALVEVLFDYRPEEWFGDYLKVLPPDRGQASAKALAQLRKIGEFALKAISLTEAQRESVEKTLAGIGEGRGPNRGIV